MNCERFDQAWLPRLTPTLSVTATTVATAMALSSGAAFTGPIMARTPDVTLPVSRLVSVEVVERLFPALGDRTVVTVSRIIAIVDVAVKAMGAVKPGTSSDKESTDEPIRPIVAIRRTAVGSVVVVTVRAARGQTDADSNLSLCNGSGSRQTDSYNSEQ